MTAYKAKFSGHETFPLRYGWLYKSAKSVLDVYVGKPDKPVTSSRTEDVESAVVRMGVGKNMVSSIRYWSELAQIVEEKDNRDTLTEIGFKIFDDEGSSDCGWDPYMEKPATIWLLHWLINSDYKVLTASRWFFNRYNGQRFDKNLLLDHILADMDRISLNVTDKTISKDIDCMFQCYGQKTSADKKVSEDSFSSPLTELGLIRIVEEGKNRKFSAELGERDSLPSEVFLYALIDFWYREARNDKTIAFDKLLTAEGSPARIFRLSQSALGNFLDDVETLSEGKISWTDTQGLRQIQCHGIEPLYNGRFDYLNRYFVEQEI